MGLNRYRIVKSPNRFLLGIEGQKDPDGSDVREGTEQLGARASGTSGISLFEELDEVLRVRRGGWCDGAARIETRRLAA